MVEKEIGLRHRVSRFLMQAFVAIVCVIATIQAASAATAVTVTGTVTKILSSAEFTYQTGFPRGHVAVLYSQSMVAPSGSVVAVGDTVSVTGTFDIYRRLVATTVALATSSYYHIATFAYDNYWAQGAGASAASVNQLVTYAQGNGKSVADCHSVANGCKAVYYMNPNHVWDPTSSTCTFHPDAEEVGASTESWFIHDTGYTDSAHRVYGYDRNGCTIWELNPGSAGLQTWWRKYLQANADKYDVYFLDADQMNVVDEGYFPYGSGGGCIPWPSFCHSTQEIPNDAAEVVAHASFVSALSHRNGSPMKFLFQQATFNIPTDMSAFAATNRFVGMSCEGCIATYATPVRPNLYANVLNEMAAANATPGAYLLLSHGNSPSGSATQTLQRLVTTGIVWLAYSEGHTIVQPDLESNTKNLAVWPEDLIYPSAPLQSMLSGSNDIQVSPGVYRREFASCYQRQVPIGPCAAVVNANASAVYVQSAWLSQTYHHVVTLSGGDVVSGGIANISGAAFVPNSTSLQAGGALLLAP